VPTNDLAPESAAAGAEGLRFDLPSPADGPTLWALAGEVGLDVNSPYAYVMWGDYFRSTSVVARRGAELVGFVLGFAVPDEPTTLFVWQIGVAASARRLGLGSRLLDHLIDRVATTHLEATVTPGNASSAALFRSLAARRRAGVEESMAYPSELLGVDHEPELRFRIGPLHPRPIHETT
jgi:L-2,4-diaminobutyric acid acetyltransferase